MTQCSLYHLLPSVDETTTLPCAHELPGCARQSLKDKEAIAAELAAAEARIAATPRGLALLRRCARTCLPQGLELKLWTVPRRVESWHARCTFGGAALTGRPCEGATLRAVYGRIGEPGLKHLHSACILMRSVILMGCHQVFSTPFLVERHCVAETPERSKSMRRLPACRWRAVEHCTIPALAGVTA